MRWVFKHPIWSFLIALFAIGSVSSGTSDSGHAQHHVHHEQVAKLASSSSSVRQSHDEKKVKSSSSHHQNKKLVVKHHAETGVSPDDQLDDLTYHSGETAFQNVNGGNSTLNPNDWNYDHIEYTNLDSLNRTSGATTAFLNANNVANDSLRQRQTVYPTGWHQKFINNEAIINRGHLIAYSLSKGIDIDGKYQASDEAGDQNNMKNLFSQTAFSNQRIQTIYEMKVRDALEAGEKVIYQVQPIFRGNELMARGIHLQAISTDRSLNFNVYLFNVQPGVRFNYQDGTSVIDHDMNVPTPAGAPDFGNNHESNHHYYNRHYYHRHYYYRHAYRHW